jgi:SpoVK/Ycf46/Vps4 family AAA+-type ATPase
LSAQFKISLPNRSALRKLVLAELKIWKIRNTDKRFHANRKSIHLLVSNLIGLTVSESQRLIRNAIYDDNAISTGDLEKVQKAKYELLGQDGVVSFEFETANFAQVGGLTNLKNWLAVRRDVFLPTENARGLDIPKGILLVGVQGCGKSLAARAVAGAWNVPLLRLDFGTLYNKFLGKLKKICAKPSNWLKSCLPAFFGSMKLRKGFPPETSIAAHRSACWQPF